MDATEVTKAKWNEVYDWAVTNGYNLSAGMGKASDHPVHSVSWYECVTWCNARSEMEGRTPCYNLNDWSCNFSASGYRLPTNKEWEYAARGGLSGKHFPWGDIIDHTQANYYGRPSNYAYDLGYEGLDIQYDTGIPPSTSPVAAFPANGYGLYDMAGNLWEWCNDDLGASRPLRGGSWLHYAEHACCRYGYAKFTSDTFTYIGFRTVWR
jgi:formylglycine-generating enzyme required for sulfatase activity